MTQGQDASTHTRTLTGQLALSTGSSYFRVGTLISAQLEGATISLTDYSFRFSRISNVTYKIKNNQHRCIIEKVGSKVAQTELKGNFKLSSSMDLGSSS